MEVEKESLLKLKNLETQLVDIIEKVDKEINQVDVEWLNLRSIAVDKMQTTQNQNVVSEQNRDPQIKSEKKVSPLSNEFRDNEFELMQLSLELNPRVNQELDEEFDSD